MTSAQVHATPTPKVVLLGDSGVGKTTLVQRWLAGDDGPVDTLTEPTIGAAFARLPAVGRYPAIDIWDTAGQERYKSLAPLYTRGAAVAVIVRAGPLPPMAQWDEAVEPGTRVVMALNKVDLPDAPQPYIGEYRVSAATGEGTRELLAEVRAMAADAQMEKRPLGGAPSVASPSQRGACC